MSTGLKRKPLGIDGHPEENQLLLALERELSAEEAAQIQLHLGSCWSCRARSAELQRGILAFVEYREKRYLPSLETPPNEFGDFPRQLRTVAAEAQPEGILARTWRKLSSHLAQPTQFRWAAVFATMMAGVVIWTQVLTPRPLSASVLLTRAAAFQSRSVALNDGRETRKARQSVRISDGRGQSVVRNFEWTIGGGRIAASEWDLRAELSQWRAPLTAEGFANWHDSASAKNDKVTRSGELWTLNTTVASDAIKEAWIVIRAQDYHPVEQHIRFADDRQMDFEELSFQILPTETVSQVAAPKEASQSFPPKAPAATPDAPVNLNETELAIRYLMFANHWDLDEDLQITRSASHVIVSGTASSPDRAQSIQAALGNQANVRASIVAPSAGQRPATSAPSIARTASAASVPLLRELLDRSFPSGDERRDFIDRALSASDTALSHAWAVKRLVDRYSEQEQGLLAENSKAQLREMLRAHLRQVDSANSGLDPLIALLPASKAPEPPAAPNWRGAILSLFNAIQQQDSLVAALIVGTQANGQDVRIASLSLQTIHHAIDVGLKQLDASEALKQFK